MRDPLLDIVVPVHDQAGWVDLCVRAVEHHTRNPFRLIVVDGASVEQKTHELLRELEARGHTVVRLAQNRSFSNAVNAGVRAGTAPNIVVLNDDAIVTEGWDAALLQDLATKSVGLVGARTNAAAGAQAMPNFRGEPPYLVFVCVAMRREVWQHVGPLDEETFDGFSGEDIDYSWRVKGLGYSLKLSNAFVLHAGHRTLMATVGDQGARIGNDARYHARLVERWGQQHVSLKSRVLPRVMVASFSAEEWTRVEFVGHLFQLRRPDGVSFSYYHHRRSPIPFARQAVSEYALREAFDYLVMLDDDSTFPSDLLIRLMGHNRDVVAALAYGRIPPHKTCAFEVGPDGLLGNELVGIEHTGLRKVDVTGLHCSMVKTDVFARLKAAGITNWYGGFDNQCGEDFAFCHHLRKVGIPVHVDTDLIAGHIGQPIVVDEQYRKAYLAGIQSGSDRPLVVRP